MATSGTNAPHLAYAGQHWDEDLGLSYAQQRWYQPGTGRFLSEDPVGVTNERLLAPTRLHVFGYGNANPLVYVDPQGTDGFFANLMRLFDAATKPSNPAPYRAMAGAHANVQMQTVIKGGDAAVGVAGGVAVAGACTLGPQVCAGLAGAGLLTSGQPTLHHAALGDCDPANPDASAEGCGAEVGGVVAGLTAGAAGTPNAKADPVATRAAQTEAPAPQAQRAPEGTYEQALALRDAVVRAFRGMGGKEYKEVATVVGGVNKRTGEVAVGTKWFQEGEFCGEDVVVQKLGGNAEEVLMTPAIRPGRPPGKDVIPVCEFCQEKYTESNFGPETQFKKPVEE